MEIREYIEKIGHVNIFAFGNYSDNEAPQSTLNMYSVVCWNHFVISNPYLIARYKHSQVESVYEKFSNPGFIRKKHETFQLLSSTDKHFLMA